MEIFRLLSMPKWIADVFIKLQNNRDSSWRIISKFVWQLIIAILTVGMDTDKWLATTLSFVCCFAFQNFKCHILFRKALKINHYRGRCHRLFATPRALENRYLMYLPLKSPLTINSVTRFGEISPLGQHLKSFCHFLSIYLVFGKSVNLLWQIFHAFGKISLF